MKHEGFATAFERLDREILALKKLVLLSEMFSWNYSAKLSAVRLEPVREPGRTRFWAHAPIEWLMAGLALTLALCACGPIQAQRAEETHPFGCGSATRALTPAEIQALFPIHGPWALTVEQAWGSPNGMGTLVIVGRIEKRKDQ